MQLPALVALALALSLDSLAVGLVYGGRRIRLPALGLLLAGGVSAAALALAMAAGALAGTGLGALWSRRLGAVFLMGAGGYALWQARHSARGGQNSRPAPPPAAGGGEEGAVWRFTWRTRTLRLAVTVLREPAAADLDASGNISPPEAILLGLALAADSFAAGIGAGLAGFSPTLLPALAGLSTAGSLYLGSRLAARLPGRRDGRWEWIHGLVLLALGLIRLW
ncbi:MAG: hypothetical protein DIU70_005260 [Bacillota bacterium]